MVTWCCSCWVWTSNNRIATKPNERMCCAVPKPSRARECCLSPMYTHIHTNTHSYIQAHSSNNNDDIQCRVFDASQSSSYAIWEYQWTCIHIKRDRGRVCKGTKEREIEKKYSASLRALHGFVCEYVVNEKCGGEYVCDNNDEIKQITKTTTTTQQGDRKRSKNLSNAIDGKMNDEAR